MQHCLIESVMAGLQAPRKLATPVSFPLDAPLDMRPFLSSSVLARRCGLRLHGAEQDAADGELEEGNAPPAALYRAYAVVCHHGNMQGGHYTAYIRCVAGWSIAARGLALKVKDTAACQHHACNAGSQCVAWGRGHCALAHQVQCTCASGICLWRHQAHESA